MIWSAREGELHAGRSIFTMPDVPLPCLEAVAKWHNSEIEHGEFSATEFQNLCHNLDETKRKEFCDGCEAYQTKLFGSSPITEMREALALIQEHKLSVSWNDRAGGFIVQRKNQVCGNIGQARTLREALNEARKELQ